MGKVNPKEMYVVKANDLIRKTRYNLTTQQQKLILYLISKIQPTDKINQWYEVSIPEICRVLDLKLDDGGTYYKLLKDELQKLTERKWCTMPDRIMTISWLGDVAIIPLNSTVQFTFNSNMQPYLFELQRNYTQYKLRDVLLFSGKYTIRLYELLQSYMRKDIDGIALPHQQPYEVTVEELRRVFDTGDMYPLYKEFKRRVLQPAVDEINEKAETMSVMYDVVKASRAGKIERIVFEIDQPAVYQTRKAGRGKR